MEFERQQIKPKPAPVMKSRAYEELSEEEKQSRRDQAEEFLNTTSLGKRLENEKYDKNFKTEDVKTGIENEKMVAYRNNVFANVKKGVQSYTEIINLLSNHHQYPDVWTVETIAEYLHLRESDVESLITYYSLIGEHETKWLMPKDARWNERHKTRLTGQDLSQKPDATVDDLINSIKNDKPIIDPFLVQKLLKYREMGDLRWHPKMMKQL